MMLFVSAIEAGQCQPPTLHLAPSSGTVPGSYFGMHIHRAGSTTPWPTVPFGSWRLWDAHAAWPNLEPQPGRWDFKNLDMYLNLAEEHHVQVLLPLGLSPKWASARPNESSVYGPGLAAEPARLTDWDDYVRTVASHCKGRVQAYEIWNEPNFNVFYTGNTDQLLELTRRAHDILKSVDPQALLVSPSVTNGVEGLKWLNEFLSKGGGRYVDVIGYHLYSQTPESMAQLIGQVKQSMSSHGVALLQLWNTETGWAKPKPFPSPELGAAYLARAYLLNWASGVQRLYWYAWDNHGFVSIETTNADDTTLAPAGRAYGIIWSWLVGSQLRSCDMTADHTWTCTLHGKQSDKWVVWNQDHEVAMILPQSWHATTTTVLNGSPAPLTGATVKVTQTPQLIVRGSEN
jgi:hypothetical protein